MANFENLKCSVCNKNFTPDADVVICPDCGAPYHRECYNQQGHCIYENVHGTSRVDNLPHNCKKDFNTEESSTEKECPSCQFVVPKDAVFCNKCGYIFPQNINENIAAQQQNNIPLMFDPMGGVSPGETLDEVKAGDIARFVRTNTPYYLPVFKKINSNNKSRFNFSSFLFPGAWFLYRKMYLLGAIITTLVFVMMIVSSFIDYAYSQSILSSLLASAGINLGSSISSAASKNLISQFYLLDIDQQILLLLPSILGFIGLIIMFASGFIANRVYFKHCIKKIKEIKDQSTSQNNYAEQLFLKGGGNINLFSVLMICYIIAKWLPGFFIK